MEPTDTDSDGYLNISTLAHLRWVGEVDKGSTDFELDNDIDASETSLWNMGDHDKDPTTPDFALGWLPIGPDHGGWIACQINGNGYTISNLYINRPKEEFVGFLRRIHSNELKDIKFKNIDITGRIMVGGLAGQISTTNTSDIDIQGSITGIKYVGGIAGEIENGITVDRCNFSGEIVGIDEVGGIAGNFWNIVDMSNCQSDAEITGVRYVGGIVGRFDGGGSEISKCASSGSILGVEYVGGIAGASSTGEIYNCFSRSSITGNDIVGGVVGESSDDWVIDNCYFAGNMESKDKAGGIAATFENWQNIEFLDNYWDYQTTNIVRSATGQARTTAEMKTQSNYVGWDFDEVWAIDPDVNDGYPYLRGVQPISSVSEKKHTASPNQLTVYPNPANNIININTALSPGSIITITGTNGITLMTFEALGQDIDISSLPRGVYFINVVNNTKSLSGRFTVQK